jgi:hypothetical protein
MTAATIILTFVLLIYLSCSTRNDKIFSASDEIHYITLYENGHAFEIIYNGVNTATGTYTLKKDTILLIYTANEPNYFDPNKLLTRKILIDNKGKSVRSLDNTQFCANIDIDNREN